MNTTTNAAVSTDLVLCELLDSGIQGVESFSPYCLKVHRALRLLGLPYERRFAARPDAHRALNPTGQVPVLLVGDRPIADSTEILRCLDELSGGGLTPGDATLRAEAWLWEEHGDTSVNGFLVAARWLDDANWPLVREAYFGAIPAAVRRLVTSRLRSRVRAGLVARDVWRRGPDACWSRFQRTLDELDARAPARGFWIADRVTVADLGLFAQLHGMRTPVTPRQSEWIRERPRLTDWLDRVDARTRAMASDAARAA